MNRQSRWNKTQDQIYNYIADYIDRVSDDFIASAGITDGTFDSVGNTRYAVPSHWDIGKVYKRLILGIARAKN